jgi:PPK2 family polyphosphate:nucleotide phosphotransferase
MDRWDREEIFDPMERYRVKPGTKVKLNDCDPDDTSEFKGDKDDSQEVLDELTDRLEVVQELLYAEHKHKLLVVLQGMDTSGKDGVIRHVFEGVNPQGVRVASFKVPTPEELDHDYLWRVHQHVPGKGEIVIFNRSHYEDVLVVRVHELVPEKQWTHRYQQITDFERMLVEEGTTILKFYLHIDKKEQKERLQARLDDPNKLWKFNVGDLKERQLWDAYIEAYEDVLSRTRQEDASWYIVPSNKKWYRNLVIATVLVETLEKLKMSYPVPKEDLSKVIIE